MRKITPELEKLLKDSAEAHQRVAAVLERIEKKLENESEYGPPEPEPPSPRRPNGQH